MDPYESAPALAELASTHKLLEIAPESTPLTNLPILESGVERFIDVNDVIRRVRELHAIADPDVAPHRSKYQARIIMTDILAILKPLLRVETYSPAELQWLTEQIGRIEYLLGVNHIEAEETSSGEKILVKALLKFKDNAAKYPFDYLDGYNHLGIVWSNRTQHGVAHAYLQQAQHTFLRFKKLRAQTLELLTEDERRLIAEQDKKEQEAEAVEVETPPVDLKDIHVGPIITEIKDGEEDEKQEEKKEDETKDLPKLVQSLPSTHPNYHFLDPVLWHQLEVTHTLTLFFLAQVFGHLKKRDLAAIYCHLCLNRQLKQRKDFQRQEWVTNAIGLSFYYSGRKLFQQAHHCLLAAQSFIKDEDFPKKMNTPLGDTTKDQQLAADLCRAWGAFYLKWLQRSRDVYIENEFALLPPTIDPTATAPSTLEATIESDIAKATKQLAASPSTASSSATATTPTTTTTAATPAPSKDEVVEPVDPSTSLSSLPEEELRELKRIQRLEREHERHFEEAVEEEADEDEDVLFGDLNKARKMKTKEQLEAEAKEKAKRGDRTLPSSLTPEEQEAVTEELNKNVEDDAAATSSTPATTTTATTASSTTSSSTSTTAQPPAPTPAASDPAASHLFIEFKALHLPPSPRCVPATSFVAARSLFKLSLEWFTRASMFYILDGYVSDNIPIQQDISLLYKLLAVFDMDLSRQCKMHKRRIDLLTPIYKQLSVASYQEFFQQLTDELATTYADMMELKQMLLQMKVRLLGSKFSEKKRDDAQQKINELALQAIQFYQIWLQSWSKDGKEVQELDEYYHRWYLMAMFKIARCYSKIYHSDPQVLNQFILKSLDQYKAVVRKAEQWKCEKVMPEELSLCKEMIQLLPMKMSRVMAKGGFRV